MVSNVYWFGKEQNRTVKNIFWTVFLIINLNCLAMKRMIFTALLIIVISAASFGRKLVAEGKTFTAMGNFKIETADKPLVVNGVSLDTYVITYDNSKMSVIVAIDKDKKCRRYLTLSDKLSVQYVCYGTHFGIEKLSEKYAKDGFKTSDAALNRSAYFHQKVLVQGQNDPVTCMKLIGAYYPELLNDLENVLATR